MSARQVRWMEKINEFDIEVNYIPGETNILADGLSRMYSNEPNGVERAKTEYVDETGQETPHILVGSTSITESAAPEVTKPLYVGDEVKAEFELRQEPRRSSRVRKQVDKYGQKPTPEQKPRNKCVKLEEIEDKEAPKIIAPKAEKLAENMVREEPQQAEIKAKGDNLEIEEMIALAKCVTEAQLPDCIVRQYRNDTLLKAITQEPEKCSNFEIKNEVLYMRKDGDLLMCIPDIKVGERKLREVINTHAHSILAQLGAKKTLQWLRTQVWWKTMVKDVYDYCESHICAVSKAATQKPQDLLHPMPIPSYPWQSTGIELVGPISMMTAAYNPPPISNQPVIPPTVEAPPALTLLMPTTVPQAPVPTPQAPTQVIQSAAPIPSNLPILSTQAPSANQTQDEVIDYEDDYTIDEAHQEAPKAT
ncbi:hypothetical protein RSOL_224150 [Rhizoctonia solani AG-3 Rhs1AP]|uniref:Integrase zinc-binding domain-containing protein n=1 Tax=Rhizoctonia solani AG-3 Rhs1AP TaxID=1086054 RepID=X8J6A2_9AGAM|nr:hypothetical protein RSOL_224150 [Rhizoctonia solani AG-3 Rhs1AP]